MKRLATLLLCLVPGPAGAGAAAADARLAALEQELEALRRRTEAEVVRLTEAIQALRTHDPDPVAGGGATRPRERLTVSADLRLRYEHTTALPPDDPARDRGTLRGRLAAEYRPAGSWTVGARLATGDPDDPNSTDVTFGEFTDDLTVSLDRAYLGWGAGDVRVRAGKFANPLHRTDLVWDSDVNPEGLAASWRLFEGAGFSAGVTGLYAIVDEQPAGPDSDLAGAQVSLGLEGASPWSARFDVGYYDYTVASLANADPGDVRGNRLDAAGTGYLSDFDLLNLLGEITLQPGGASWPVSFTADYVRNLGADDSDDTGWSGAVAVGRLEEPGDLRFRYGYSLAETDAVFAAYSQDNVTYATNYRLHAVTVDYVPLPGMRLNITGYRYRRDEPLEGGDEPVNRIRLNWSVAF